MARGKKTSVRKAMQLKAEQMVPIVPTDRMTPEAAENCLAYIEAGGSLSAWANRAGLETRTVWQYMHGGFYNERLEEARKKSAAALVDEALRISVTPLVMEEEIVTILPDGSESRTVKRSDAVAARKLAVQTRIDIARMYDPQRFGERTVLEAGDSMVSAIAAARKRIGKGE